MPFMRRTALWCSLLLALLLMSSCAAAPEKHERQVFAMDTVMFLTAYGDAAEEGLRAAEERILALEAELDPERPEGALYALNRAQGAETRVSEPVERILSVGMEVWERSGGALDYTLYPVIRAWGFGGDGSGYRVPEKTELHALLAETGMDGVELDGDRVVIPAGRELSFGAAAKGYAAQAAAEAMREAGVESGILTLGGNVQSVGATRPDGKRWTVAIQDPFDTGEYMGTLSLGESAVVTSGSYQRNFEAEGRVWHHILDPTTGYPAESGLVSATVVCPDGTTADALSTALFVLGEKAALEYRARYGGFELVLITQDRRVIVTGGLDFTERGDYAYEYVE